MVLSNPTGCFSQVTAGTAVGVAAEVQGGSKSVQAGQVCYCAAKTIVCSVTSKINQKERLLELIEKPTLLNDQQAHELFDFLTNHHSAFNLDDLDRGETDLQKMQGTGVIEPSSSL